MLVFLAAVVVAAITDHHKAAAIAFGAVFAAVLAGLVIAARRKDLGADHEGAHPGWSPVAELGDDTGPIVSLAELLETPVFAATARTLHVRVGWEPPPFVWDADATERIEAVAAA